MLFLSSGFLSGCKRSHKAKKGSSSSAGIESTTCGFDRLLLYRLSYEARREQVLDDDGGNCANKELLSR